MEYMQGEPQIEIFEGFPLSPPQPSLLLERTLTLLRVNPFFPTSFHFSFSLLVLFSSSSSNRSRQMATEAPTGDNSALKPATASANSVSSAEVVEGEKPVTHTTTIDLERVGETQGYVLDEAQLREKLGLAPDVSLKKSRKGVVLIPQPTDSSEDPYNWSPLKKGLILLVLAVNACTADYSAATGASALLPQAEEWHISPDEVNHATAG
jgi:hypothetical protein